MEAIHCPRCDHPADENARFCANCGENLLEAVSKISDDPFLGKRLADSYLIQELIGVGAMGRVYKAEQVSLGKTVAVKILHRHLLGDPSLEKRFQREARAAARLQHPNCISVIDFGKAEDDSLFIAMEYLEGKNLGEVLRDAGPLPWRRALHILRQTAAALDEAHNNGVIHRDLKPENIVLEDRRSDKDFVKVLDFGIAKVQEADNRDGVLTIVGSVCGTPEYMSPEQARGERDIDARTDVYAMGCILYHMLTGELPFSGESALAVVTRHLSDDPVPPTERAPDADIPRRVEKLCLRALAKDRADRPPSALAFAMDLDSLLAVDDGPAPISRRTTTDLPPQLSEARAADGMGSLLPELPEDPDEEGVVASVRPPEALKEAGEIERAITPAATAPPAEEQVAATLEPAPLGFAGAEAASAPAPDPDGPARPPHSAPDVQTSPANPMHPTPMIAGEVVETERVGVHGHRRLLVAAVVLVACAGIGLSIWMAADRPRPARVIEPIELGAGPEAPAATTPVPATTEPPAAVPAPAEGEGEPAVEAQESDEEEEEPARRHTKRKGKRKGKRKPKEGDGARAARKDGGAALFDQGEALFRSGRNQEAINAYKEAMAAGLRDPEVHYELGRCYSRLSQAESAARHYRTYLKLKPNTSKRRTVEAILDRPAKE